MTARSGQAVWEENQGGGLTQDEADGRYLKLSGGTLTGDLKLGDHDLYLGPQGAVQLKVSDTEPALEINMGGPGVKFYSGNKIGNLGGPTEDADAVNKGYVDGLAGSINTKAVKSYGVLSAANVLTWAKQQDGSGAFNVNPTVTTEGVPTAAWYSGFLEKSADGAYKLTLTRADNGQTFVNVTYAQEWIGWIELATVDELADKVGLAGNVSELGDMNLANIANQFYVIMESDAIQNLPYNSRGFNNSVVYNRGQENAVFTQTLYTPQLKAVYQRHYIGWLTEESRWSAWEQIATMTLDVSTAGARAISAGTTDLTAGSSALATGQIYLVYG